MAWPVLTRDPLRLPTLPGQDDALWDALVELCDVRPGQWTLVGGQMVYLHALEHGVPPPRVSTDLDIVVNARVVSGAVAAFAPELVSRGFAVDGISAEGLAHRYKRGPVSIDVLAPDGLGDRANLTTTPPGRTLQVPGGTQALDRTELLPVATSGRTGRVPRPSLLGAIVGKALAVRVDDVPDAQRLDLAFLLSLVDDPFTMAAGLSATDKRRLRARSELADSEHPVWRRLGESRVVV